MTLDLTTLQQWSAIGAALLAASVALAWLALDSERRRERRWRVFRRLHYWPMTNEAALNVHGMGRW